MSNEPVKQIMDKLEQQGKMFQEHIKQQQELDEKRLAASWKVYEGLQATTRELKETTAKLSDGQANIHKDSQELHEKMDTLSEEVKPVLVFISNVTGFKVTGSYITRGVVYTAIVLGAIGTLGFYGKKFILTLIR